MITTIPLLETARLRLRGHARADFARASQIWGDPKVVRYIGGKPSTPQQCWARLMHYQGHWQIQGFGYWAVEEKSSGLYIGDIGMADFKRDIEPSLDGLPELGWVLSPEVHGKGYATEAVCAVIAWAETHLPKLTRPTKVPGAAATSKFVSEKSDADKFPLKERRMMAIIDVNHQGSIRVAEKCGFVECGRTKFMDEPVVMFERRF